jgi:hypothetical protein
MSLKPNQIRNAVLVKELKNSYRIRVGNFRILYTPLHKLGAIAILTIDIHHDAYQNLENNEKIKEEELITLNEKGLANLYDEIFQMKRKSAMKAFIKYYLQKSQCVGEKKQKLTDLLNSLKNKN